MSNFKKIKEASTKISKDLAKVEEHYQNYPHPFRDPNQEKERLLTVCGEFLGELNHFLYKGKENFDNGFRCLVVGGAVQVIRLFILQIS